MPNDQPGPDDDPADGDAEGPPDVAPSTTETDPPADDGADPDDRSGAESLSPGTSGTDTDATDPDIGTESEPEGSAEIPDDVQRYDRFQKIDTAMYDRTNTFLRDRTYITAREWAIARLCADFRTETGVEMTKIGENLPHLVPFMTDTYTPQAVNQARSSFEEKVTKSGATFLYGAMCDFFTAEELEDLMYEVTEVAKFLLEVEGVELSVDEELAAEDRISSVMREVRSSSAALRYDHVECPECGHEIDARSGGHEQDHPVESDD